MSFPYVYGGNSILIRLFIQGLPRRLHHYGELRLHRWNKMGLLALGVSMGKLEILFNLFSIFLFLFFIFDDVELV